MNSGFSSRSSYGMALVIALSLRFLVTSETKRSISVMSLVRMFTTERSPTLTIAI